MKTLEMIRAEWGSDDFEVVPKALVGDQVPASLQHALCEIGLPVRPADSLKLNLRFDNVQIEHRPQELRLLDADDFEPGSTFPRSGQAEFDAKATLDRFLLIGECPSLFSGFGSLTCFICIDSGSGEVYWVYPKLRSGRIEAFRINSSFHGYLGSLLAYKKFRDQWPALIEKYPDVEEHMDEEYAREAKPLYEHFLGDLQEADPDGFKGGFWEEHAWNEAILLQV